MSRAPLDWTDPAEARAWLASLGEAIDDLYAAAEDQVRPPSRRRLGRAEAKRLVGDARASITEALEHARSGIRGSSDPAGCGGAGPTH